jgi:hypothetical protein
LIPPPLTVNYPTSHTLKTNPNDDLQKFHLQIDARPYAPASRRTEDLVVQSGSKEAQQSEQYGVGRRCRSAAGTENVHGRFGVEKGSEGSVEPVPETMTENDHEKTGEPVSASRHEATTGPDTANQPGQPDPEETAGPATETRLG